MATSPDKVVRRYNECRDSGRVYILKIFLNNWMVCNFNADVQTAISCSQILSAIDQDTVNYLSKEELELLDQHLIHRRG